MQILKQVHDQAQQLHGRAHHQAQKLLKEYWWSRPRGIRWALLFAILTTLVVAGILARRIVVSYENLFLASSVVVASGIIVGVLTAKRGETFNVKLFGATTLAVVSVMGLIQYGLDPRKSVRWPDTSFELSGGGGTGYIAWGNRSATIHGNLSRSDRGCRTINAVARLRAITMEGVAKSCEDDRAFTIPFDASDYEGGIRVVTLRACVETGDLCVREDVTTVARPAPINE